MSRHTRMVLLSILAGIIVVAGLAGVIGAINGQAQVRTITTTTAPAPTTTVVSLSSFGAAGKELDKLAATGRTSVFHATYDVSDPKLPEGLLQTVEVWRNAKRFRSDIIERASNGTKRTTNLTDGSTDRQCVTVNGSQTCQITNVAPVDLVIAFLRAVHDDKTPPKLTVHSEKDIAGFQARCFDGGDLGEVCLTTDGVLLRLQLQGATITAARIDDEVPASAFDVSG
jgi:hypothetical protein